MFLLLESNSDGCVISEKLEVDEASAPFLFSGTLDFLILAFNIAVSVSKVPRYSRTKTRNQKNDIKTYIVKNLQCCRSFYFIFTFKYSFFYGFSYRASYSHSNWHTVSETDFATLRSTFIASFQSAKWSTDGAAIIIAYSNKKAKQNSDFTTDRSAHGTTYGPTYRNTN